MAENTIAEEIFNVATRKDLAEVGGAHNQKGVDFQRYWALMRIFQLEHSGQDDFLFLFEAIQDIAEFDSSASPSSVRVYQVKKKDRGEWTWAELIKLPTPKGRKPLFANSSSRLPVISGVSSKPVSLIGFGRPAFG